MLLVSSPTAAGLASIVEGLCSETLAREAVTSWQKAVFAEFGWDLPITESDGYWYFHALGLADLPFPGGYFLRPVDFEEYLADLRKVPGGMVVSGVRHLRTFEVNHAEVRWPLAVIDDRHDLMQTLPGVRGTWERRLDLVEHCHLAFAGENYLLIRQFDEYLGQLLMLGTSRDRQQAERLLRLLGVTDYMFP